MKSFYEYTVALQKKIILSDYKRLIRSNAHRIVCMRVQGEINDLSKQCAPTDFRV